MDGWTDKWMARWTDRRTSIQIDEQIDRLEGLGGQNRLDILDVTDR